MTDHDPVNHPKHYTTHPSVVECIQVTRHMSFNLGNAAPALEPQWIVWNGGACPVSPDLRVEVRRHDGNCVTDLAGYFCWYHAAAPYVGDIVAYRVVG